ncbi:MAG: hypothetical protein ACT4NJ_03195 [Nitrosopumilaceae archaeon]
MIKINNVQRLQAITLSLLITSIGFPSVFADPGELSASSDDLVGITSLDPVDGLSPLFSGKGGYSLDACGTNSPPCSVDADVPAGSTVAKAYVYVVSNSDLGPTVTIDFDGTAVTATKLPQNDHAFLDSYRADVTTQVATKVGGGGGLTPFSVNDDPGGSGNDGVALLVTFNNSGEPFRSIIGLDGGLQSTGASTLIGFAAPLDKTISGFEALLSLGISFSFQGGATPHLCGSGQFSNVDINGVRLSSCAGHWDDGGPFNGGLITVGGVGDNTANPPDPNGPGGEDDELYNVAGLLAQGDTMMDIDTVNPSGDDNIFLAVLSITAKASLEICNNGIDDDGDGLVDIDDPDCQVEEPPVVGGKFLPIDATALLVAGAQTNAVWILSALAVIGSVAFGTLYLKTRKD